MTNKIKNECKRELLLELGVGKDPNKNKEQNKNDLLLGVKEFSLNALTRLYNKVKWLKSQQDEKYKEYLNNFYKQFNQKRKMYQSRISQEFNKYKQWCGIYGKKPSSYENLKEFYKVLEVVK